MTDTNILSIILAVVSYLMIGFIFETRRPFGKFDFGALLLWPFGLDIRVKSWFKLRHIAREGKQRLAEAVAERDSKLRVVDIKWVDETAIGEAIVTVGYGDEITDWRGSGFLWQRLPDGARPSDWMENWLYQRWTGACRYAEEKNK